MKLLRNPRLLATLATLILCAACDPQETSGICGDGSPSVELYTTSNNSFVTLDTTFMVVKEHFDLAIPGDFTSANSCRGHQHLYLRRVGEPGAGSYLALADMTYSIETEFTLRDFLEATRDQPQLTSGTYVLRAQLHNDLHDQIGNDIYSELVIDLVIEEDALPSEEQ